MRLLLGILMICLVGCGNGSEGCKPNGTLVISMEQRFSESSTEGSFKNYSPTNINQSQNYNAYATATLYDGRMKGMQIPPQQNISEKLSLDMQNMTVGMADEMGRGSLAKISRAEQSYGSKLMTSLKNVTYKISLTQAEQAALDRELKSKSNGNVAYCSSNTDLYLVTSEEHPKDVIVIINSKVEAAFKAN